MLAESAKGDPVQDAAADDEAAPRGYGTPTSDNSYGSGGVDEDGQVATAEAYYYAEEESEQKSPCGGDTDPLNSSAPAGVGATNPTITEGEDDLVHPATATATDPVVEAAGGSKKPRETLLHFLSKKVTDEGSGNPEELHKSSSTLGSSDLNISVHPPDGVHQLSKLGHHRHHRPQHHHAAAPQSTPKSTAELERLAAEALKIADSVIAKSPRDDSIERPGGIGFEEKLWDNTLVAEEPSLHPSTTTQEHPPNATPAPIVTPVAIPQQPEQHIQHRHSASRFVPPHPPEPTKHEDDAAAAQLEQEKARKFRLAALRKKRNQSLMDGLRNRDFDVHFVEMIQHLPVEHAIDSIGKYYQEGKHLLFKQIHDAQTRAMFEVRAPASPLSRRRGSNNAVAMREPVMPPGTDAQRRQILASVLQKRREQEAVGRSQLNTSGGVGTGAGESSGVDRRQSSNTQALDGSRRRSSAVTPSMSQVWVELGGDPNQSIASRPPVLRSLRHRRSRISSVATQRSSQRSSAASALGDVALGAKSIRMPISDALADDADTAGELVEDTFILFFKTAEKLKVTQLMDSASPFRFIGEMSFCYMFPTQSSATSNSSMHGDDESLSLQDSLANNKSTNNSSLFTQSNSLVSTGITKVMVRTIQDEIRASLHAQSGSGSGTMPLSTRRGSTSAAPNHQLEIEGKMQQKLLVLLHDMVERFIDEGGVEKKSGSEGFCFFTTVTSFGRIVDEVDYKGMQIRVSRTGLIEEDPVGTSAPSAPGTSRAAKRADAKPVTFTLGPSENDNARSLGRTASNRGMKRASSFQKTGATSSSGATTDATDVPVMTKGRRSFARQHSRVASDDAPTAESTPRNQERDSGSMSHSDSGSGFNGSPRERSSSPPGADPPESLNSGMVQQLAKYAGALRRRSSLDRNLVTTFVVHKTTSDVVLPKRRYARHAAARGSHCSSDRSKSDASTVSGKDDDERQPSPPEVGSRSPLRRLVSKLPFSTSRQLPNFRKNNGVIIKTIPGLDDFLHRVQHRNALMFYPEIHAEKNYAIEGSKTTVMVDETGEPVIPTYSRAHPAVPPLNLTLSDSCHLARLQHGYHLQQEHHGRLLFSAPAGQLNNSWDPPAGSVFPSPSQTSQEGAVHSASVPHPTTTSRGSSRGMPPAEPISWVERNEALKADALAPSAAPAPADLLLATGSVIIPLAVPRFSALPPPSTLLCNPASSRPSTGAAASVSHQEIAAVAMGSCSMPPLSRAALSSEKSQPFDRMLSRPDVDIAHLHGWGPAVLSSPSSLVPPFRAPSSAVWSSEVVTPRGEVMLASSFCSRRLSPNRELLARRSGQPVQRGSNTAR